jgi:hypothetical protein
VQPATNAQPLAVLHAYDIRYVVTYFRRDVETGPPVPADERDAIAGVLAAVAEPDPLSTATT